MENENDVIRFSERVIEVIKKIPLPLVFLLLSVTLLMVYWFLSIFLFHREFYSANYIGITILFSFAFSFTWFTISIGLSILSVAFLDREKEDKTDVNGVLFVSWFISIVYLCLCMLAMYLLRRYYTDLGFQFFLLISYGYMILQVLRIGFGWVYLLIFGNKKLPN